MEVEQVTVQVHPGVTTHQVAMATEDCRQIQLSIQLFNEGFRFIVSTLKWFCTAATILLLTFAIRIMQKGGDPIFASLYGLMALQFKSFFLVAFDRASTITSGLTKYKKAVRIGASELILLGKLRGAEFKKTIKSIRNPKIPIRRLSTLNFMGKVAKVIVKLLLVLK
jgi:hypothetical protein